MRGIIFTETDADRLLVGRTERALRATGIAKIDRTSADHLVTALRASEESVWLIRAGAWQERVVPVRDIPRSSTGRALIGIGHGGPSIYLEATAAHALAEYLERGVSRDAAIRKLGRHRGFRAVPLHDMDVAFDPSPRAIQLVTSIQMGGAERVALDLAHEFNRTGWRTALVAIGSPTRRAYQAPPWFVDLSGAGLAPENRADAVLKAALSFGADVIHAHLIRADEAGAIRARGLPLAVTIHNALPIWPEGCAEAQSPFADLLIGCAEGVTREIESHFPREKPHGGKEGHFAPVRTVWNGIDASRTAPTQERNRAGASLREQLGWDPSDFVLLSVANPRPQKRLHLLPEIVARLEDLIAPRRVRLLLAGEPAMTNPAARECMMAFYQEVDRWHLRKATHWVGAADDVAPLLAAADALIAVSSHEGLSLAQLEALAAGLPVVATHVGGTREIAVRSVRFSLLAADAAPEAFAISLAAIAQAPPPRVAALPVDFARDVMARRMQLYLHSLVASRALCEEGECVWLITNNFTTGGAQSSARRLLTGLHLRGYAVRAATLEEWPDRPDHGTLSLRNAGVQVTSIRPTRDANAMVSELIEAMAVSPPRAVLFWNVMPPVKVLLADLLTMWPREDGSVIPIFDVSPGEMLFQSLDRFLKAKPAGWAIRSARDYGGCLAGAVVKYGGESERAEAVLGTRVSVIRNGIPDANPILRRNGGKLVIGTVARLSPDKRLEELIEAFRLARPRLPKCRLRIAGGPDGENEAYMRELRKAARGLPVDWCGDIRDVPRFLGGLDLFAMISEPAGCPNASLEGMAVGLAVVATNHGGAHEQVIDGVTGRLVERGDVQGFANALVELANDGSLRTTMGAAGREHVQREFSMERMLDSYARLIEGAVR